MSNLATIVNNILADSGIDDISVVIGSGTSGYIPVFTSTGRTIGNSILNQSGGNLLIGGNIALHAGNFNSYAPTLTGVGASGTWGISITGNADTVDGYHMNQNLLTSSSPTFAGLTTNGSIFINGIGVFTSSSDHQISLRSPDAWTGIEFDDSQSGFDYIWFNGIYQTFAIGGGGASVLGKKLHIDGGTTIGVNYDSTSVPTNGLNVEGPIQQAGNQVLHAGNFNSYAPTLTGGGASGTWGISITGNANTATNLSNSWTNWNSVGGIGSVVGMLAWKNYGNNHVIFDASQSTSPSGSGVNSSNPDVTWSASYPTLMGWNGSSTYGVRVDSARYSDFVGGFSAATFYRNIGFGSGYPSWNLNTVDPDRSGFTYGNGGPYTGPFIHIGASGYGLQFNAPYGGDGYGLAFRTRNGDTGSWNSWQYPVVYGINVNGGGAVYSTIYYDQNDTGYYIDPNTTATSINVRGEIRNPSIWINDGDNFNNYNENIRLFNAPNGVSVIAFGASGTGGVPQSSILGFSDRYEVRVGASQSWQQRSYDGYTEINGSSRAPIFYDSNDTGYYVDPNSASSLNILNVGNGAGGNQRIVFRAGNDTSAYSALRFEYGGVERNTIHLFGPNWSSGSLAGQSTGAINLSGYNGVTFGPWNAAVMWVDNSGNAQANGSMRAPVFYQAGNTFLKLQFDDPNTSLRIQGGIAQNQIVGRPAAYWGATSASGPVVIKFPGDTNNYGMIHAVIDIYEYNSNNVCTVIIGGHNWAGAWYNYGGNVIGFTDKPVRLAVKDGKYCIVIGDAYSSWSYGQVVLRKIQNGTYYSGVMDIAGGYTVAIESDSFSWDSGDILGDGLKTKNSFRAYSSDRCWTGSLSPYGVAGNDTSYCSIWQAGGCGFYQYSYGYSATMSPYTLQINPPSGECFCYDTWGGGNLYIGGNICQNWYSDCKYKENITEIDSALDKIEAIRGVEFDWNELGEEEAFRKGHEVGVIAQEVQAVYPQAVREVSKEREDHVVTALVVDYEKFTPLLIQSIKELKIKVDNIKSRLDAGGL